MPGSMILKAFLLSVITASISFFIVHSQLLEDLRERIQERLKFFGDLLSCCYCLSHWVAVIMVIIFSVRLFDCGWVVMDIVLTILVVAWFASLQSMAMRASCGETDMCCGRLKRLTREKFRPPRKPKGKQNNPSRKKNNVKRK